MNGNHPAASASAASSYDDAAISYDDAAIERWVPEPDKRPGRTAFQRDRARVLHSAALRRLAGKTQVVDPAAAVPEINTSPRTRLTHSLECAQVGRELGAALGCDADLVEAACLAHDLGHPPFGHNGEQALTAIAAACGGFEGNAQSLRLLTRLEPKRFSTDEAGRLRSVGLNLTRAALDAATKYPWPLTAPGPGGEPVPRAAVAAAIRETGGADGPVADSTGAGATGRDAAPGRRAGKFGVYEDDLPVFTWLREGAPPGTACFEAQIMDWADDVAYSVHDVEDGLHAEHLDPAALRAGPERRAVYQVAIDRYAPDADPEELAEALDRLLAEEWWPHRYDGSALAQARLKDAASQLIGRFCVAAEQATRTVYGPGRLTRYGARLVVPRDVRLECAVLKAVADRYVIQRPDQARRRAEQRIVIAELAQALIDRAPDGLGPQFRALWEEAVDDRARLRAIVDQIASLTDAAALALHHRLTHPGIAAAAAATRPDEPLAARGGGRPGAQLRRYRAE